MNKLAIAFSLLAIFLLSGGGLLAANAYGSSSQYEHHYQRYQSEDQSYQSTSTPLSFTMSGGVAGAGSQFYIIHESGQAVSANLAGVSIDPTQPIQIHYDLSAYVHRVSATGYAHFFLRGQLVGGGRVTVEGYAPINGEVPAVCLPSGSTTGTCASTDTSSVPAFFVASSATLNVVMTINGQTSTETFHGVPMLFESAYMNPFGAPIVFGTADNFATLLVVTPYNTGLIFWNGVVTMSQISGTYGQTPVVGMGTQITSETENMVSGNTSDHGTMIFSDMVNATSGKPLPALDASGQFSGSSSTPSTGGIDCSISIGFPAGSGVCTMYGFNSVGSYHIRGQGTFISGSYSTQWGDPAFVFVGASTATVSTIGDF